MPRHYHPDVPDEMKGAIESFNNTTSDIVDSFARKLNEQPPPSTIFHYTDDLGLRGIIEYGTLRLTDIFYLNDPSELRHGCRPAIELITSAANETQPEIKQLAENIEGRLIKGIEQAFRFFTLSFSQDGDDLGQWRAYADNGRGYALGFDGRILQQAFVKPGNNWVTFPVCYSENDLRRIHEEIVHHGLPLISMPREKGLTSDAKNNYMHELLLVFVVSIIHAALFFKHKAYSNEKEYRFLLFPHGIETPELRYRSRPYSLIRFREFDWRSIVPNSLTQIILGPSADHDKAERFAKDCLAVYHAKYHVGDVRISRSDIPYRAV